MCNLKVINWICLLVGAFFVGCSPVLASEIQFTNDIPEEQIRLVQDDLEYFKNFQFEGELMQQEFFQVFENPAQQMLDWLHERVSVIIGENHSLGSEVVRVIGQIEKPTDPVSQISRGGLAMKNVGALLYRAGKEKNKKLALRLEGLGLIPLSSPRVGILQMGHAFFRSVTVSSPHHLIDSRINRMFRLSVLLHEARHSDGRGDSLAFAHVMCPEDHDYQGKYACDRFQNGAYFVSMLMFDWFLKSCSDCSEGERDALSFLTLDSSARILNSPLGQGSWLGDEDPEFLQ